MYFFRVAAVKTLLCFTFAYQQSNSKDLGYFYVSPPVLYQGEEFMISLLWLSVGRRFDPDKGQGKVLPVT